MAQRRTNDEMFDMGTWVASTLADIKLAMEAEAPNDATVRILATFGDFLADMRNARNWSALEELRSHWQVNQDGAMAHERSA